MGFFSVERVKKKKRFETTAVDTISYNLISCSVPLMLLGHSVDCWCMSILTVAWPATRSPLDAPLS